MNFKSPQYAWISGLTTEEGRRDTDGLFLIVIGVYLCMLRLYPLSFRTA
jgi:hypothetical protein